MILGITGGSGCGKTTLLAQVERLGGLVLDCDEIYHSLLSTDEGLLGSIENRFPGTVASSCGKSWEPPFFPMRRPLGT